MWEDRRVRALGGLAGILLIVMLLTVALGLYYGFLFDRTPQTRDQAIVANWRAFATAPGATVDQQQAYALALLDAGDVSGARDQMRNIESREDFDPERGQNVLFLSAEILRAEGDLTAAATTFTQAMEFMDEAYQAKLAEGGESNWAVAFGLHENYFLSALARGAIYQEQGDYAAAVEMYDLFLENRPPDTSVLVARGEAKAALGDTAGAEADFRDALRFIPDHAPALQGLEKIGAAR